MHMTEGDAAPHTVWAMHEHYRGVLGDRAEKRVINKCPHLSNKVRYVRAIFPDARFVHIVRDPVAMVASWVNIMGLVPDLAIYWPDVPFPCLWVYDRNDALLEDKEPDRFYPGQGLLRFADYWSAINAGIPLQAANFQDQLLTIRYEDLIAEPVATLRQITDFCQLEAFQTVPVQIDARRNGARDELLSGGDVAEIRRITAPIGVQYGYG